MCRACGQKEETQQHILEECQNLHTDQSQKTREEEIFSEDTKTLKNTDMKITKTIDKLEKI